MRWWKKAILALGGPHALYEAHELDDPAREERPAGEAAKTDDPHLARFRDALREAMNAYAAAIAAGTQMITQSELMAVRRRLEKTHAYRQALMAAKEVVDDELAPEAAADADSPAPAVAGGTQAGDLRTIESEVRRPSDEASDQPSD